MAAEEDSDSDDDSSSSSSGSIGSSRHQASQSSSRHQASQSSSRRQASQSHSVGVDFFEIPPATPGTVVPPPPPPNTTSIAPENKQAQSGSKLRQVEQISQHIHGSPPRTTTRKHRPSSGSMTPDQKSSSRTPPTRRPRPRPMTPDQKQAKSPAKLRTLGSQHIGLPSPPASPITPGSPMTPDSAATYGGFGHQTSNLAYSAARSCPSDYVDRENLSPSRRVVKGRRRRIR